MTEPYLSITAEVAAALQAGRPLVALESTVITHGLPRPTNLETARRLETIVIQAGALPATVAVLDGQLRVGLAADELERLANDTKAVKVSRRDLGPALASRMTGGTTVSATMLAAAAAGVRVFATGGIGGVHRGPTGDVSADLPELARTPVAVVCAGAKSILDLPRTLEWLETAGVPVIGWGTNEFPAFYAVSSGLPVSARADTAGAITAMLRAAWDLGLTGGALVTVPVPAEDALDPVVISQALEQAERRAAQAGIAGSALTPYLLAQLNELTDGASMRANLALLANNARAAAELAVALAVNP